MVSALDCATSGEANRGMDNLRDELGKIVSFPRLSNYNIVKYIG